jgi:AraC-like DNA-binding protein/quercetin dioxygenase-like cupin family protein
MAKIKQVSSSHDRLEPFQLHWELSDAKDRRIRIRRDFYAPDTRYPLHQHDWAELILVEHGRLLHAGDGWQQTLDRGTLALIPRACRHRLASPAAAACVIVNMAIKAELIAALQMLAADPQLAFLLGDGQPRLQSLSSFDLVLCARLITEYAAREDERLAISLLLLLLERCARGGTAGGLPPALQEAVAALAEPEHLREGIAFLARRSGYHPDHIARLMKACHGCTTSELITQLRLDHLADLVLHGQRPIAEICASCGISNRTHANRRFRQRYGCTPAALRARA